MRPHCRGISAAPMRSHYGGTPTAASPPFQQLSSMSYFAVTKKQLVNETNEKISRDREKENGEHGKGRHACHALSNRPRGQRCCKPPRRSERRTMGPRLWGPTRGGPRTTWSP